MGETWKPEARAATMAEAAAAPATLSEVTIPVQGYLAHRKQPPPRNRRDLEARRESSDDGRRGSGLRIWAISGSIHQSVYMNDFCSRPRRARPDTVLTERDLEARGESSDDGRGGPMRGLLFY